MKSNDGAIFGGGEIGIKHFADPAILINPDHHRENQTLVNQTPVDFSQEVYRLIADSVRFWRRNQTHFTFTFHLAPAQTCRGGKVEFDEREPNLGSISSRFTW